MRRPWLCLLALLVGCPADDSNPSPADGGDDNADSTGPATSDGVGDDQVDSMDTPADSTSDAADSSDDATTGPSAPNRCWFIDTLATAPAEVDGGWVRDGDGDGAQELYLYDISTDLDSTTLLRVGADLDDELTLAGALLSITDVDGDGTLDAFTQTSIGVFDVYLGSGGTFDSAATPVDFPGGEFVGAHDVDGDGLTDMLLRASDVSLTLALGDGTGMFTADTTLGVPAQSNMEAYVSFESGAQFGLRSQPALGTRLCPDKRVDTIEFADGGLVTLATGPMDAYGEPVAVRDTGGDGFPDVFITDCNGNPMSTTLYLLADEGNGGLDERTVADAVSWAVPADIDGNGAVDLVWGDAPDGDTILDIDIATPGGVELTNVPAGNVSDNAVWAADLDGSGDEQILRVNDGTVERLYVVPCE